MNGLDIFSGIGGITKALEGYVRPVAYCENDRYAQSVLLSRMSDGELPIAPIWNDVRTLHSKSIPKPDIIYGGFPCQDISCAGRGAGLEGERSGLFSEIIRLVSEIRPRFVFLENVPAIRTRGGDTVAGGLASLGYDCRWDTLSASDVGANHRRERWWLLAYACSGRHAPQSRSVARVLQASRQPDSSELSCDRGQDVADAQRSERRPDAQRWHEPDGDDARREEAASGIGERREDVADAKGVGKRESADQANAVAGSRDARTESRGRGWWSTEPNVGRSIDGVSDWLDGSGGLGSDEETQGIGAEVLSYMQKGILAKAIWETLRRLDGFQAEEFLLSFVCEYESGGRLSREFMEGKAAPQDLLRTMRSNRKAPCASCERGSFGQYLREYPDALRALSQLVAPRGSKAWDNAMWESTLQRVATGVFYRVDRLRALGNAVVPAQAREAFERLMGL